MLNLLYIKNGQRKYLRNKNTIDFDIIFLLTIDQKAFLTQLNSFKDTK